jgi:hypothetical protein
MSIFQKESLETFSRSYPEVAHKIAHNLTSHPLLSLESLARLADATPMKDRECNVGNVPVGGDVDLYNDSRPEQQLENLGDRILDIDNAGVWLSMRHIQNDTAYKALLDEILDELRAHIGLKTGAIRRVEGFFFITSPGGVAPYHFDPEHNLLMQVRGSKVMTTFPAGDTFYASDEAHEAYHLGGRPELTWRAEMEQGGTEFPLSPGEALFVPLMAPHFVRNGNGASVSLSVTWRSDWSMAEADARALNGLIRKTGIAPRTPGRWPAQNRAKSLAWSALRKTGVVGKSG